MGAAAYELAAYAMRYWFIFLTVGILIALIYISYKEFREKKFVFTQVEKYGGYLEIVDGPEEFIGDQFGLTEQNTIGRARKCSVSIPDDSILKTHLLIEREEDEFYAIPMSKRSTMVNGRELTRKQRIKTGDVLSVGVVDLEVHLKKARVEHDI